MAKKVKSFKGGEKLPQQKSMQIENTFFCTDLLHKNAFSLHRSLQDLCRAKIHTTF